MVDPASFGSSRTVGPVVDAAAANLVPVYVARRDGSLDDALSQPLNRESIEALNPVAAADIGRTGAREPTETAETRQ